MSNRSYDLYTKLQLLCLDDFTELLELMYDVISAGIAVADIRRVFSLLLVVRAADTRSVVELDSKALSDALEKVRRK